MKIVFFLRRYCSYEIREVYLAQLTRRMTVVFSIFRVQHSSRLATCGIS